jgi:glutathione synthase/RimK-type ligase-like ATP-grasp enzyme
VERFLAEQQQTARGQLVINLCRHYKYLSHGYYCSLLAEARGQKVIPPIRTINDLSKKPLYATDLEKLDIALNKIMRKYGQPDVKNLRVKIFFGQTQEESLQEFARQVFEMFPCPILQVDFKHNDMWSVFNIRPAALDQLSEPEEDLFANALDHFSRKVWRKRRTRRRFRYDMAILTNRNEKLPPSNKRALAQFVRAGREAGIDVDIVTKKDLVRLAEYDALFIRETTSISDHTYQFAKKAESEGMVVIDDPNSIVRCTNKVYLDSLLRGRGVPTPKTRIVSRHEKELIDALANELGLPIVLKIPDGSFSRGVVKANDKNELKNYALDFFKKSALILAQEFLYTDYDWRIGVLNGKALFACQYFMTKGHWQIYNHARNGQVSSGNFTTMPVRSAPQAVVRFAIKAANFIGNGLYGVDIKQTGDKAVVIEVNDNPNIDAGVEDDYLGFDLYRQIIGEVLRRLEQKRLGVAP